MEEKQLFINGLRTMQEMAAAKDHHITIGEILQCFPGMELDKEQIALIYSYADEKNIIIDDYELHDTRSVVAGGEKNQEPELTGEEKEYFKMYLADLEAIEPCDVDEMEMLVERLLGGEDQVIKRLTEGNLHLVLDVAKEHAGKGILIGDLVQEGNMALFQALLDLSLGMESLTTDFETFLKEKTAAPMLALLEEHAGYKKAGINMAREANRLMVIAADLEEELGREATLAELSAKAQLPEDQVRELIQESLNAAEFANMDRENPSDNDSEGMTAEEFEADPMEEK